MLAMVVKEFRQLRRDRRTLAMMIVLPVVLLVVFGYAASFDVDRVPVRLIGPDADRVAAALPELFDVEAVRPEDGRADAVRALRDGDVPAVIDTGADRPTVLLDGTELFVAQAVRTAVGSLPDTGGAGSALGPGEVEVEVLFNPALDTSVVMVPGLAALILLFVGTVLTSLGVVRERQAGTLEQLAVMPLRPADVFLGKIGPYFVVAAADLAIVVLVGVWLFDVPFRGSVLTLTLAAFLFLFVTLGIGVLISMVSENQGQAIQLALMVLLPQLTLSGLIFPLSSMAAGVRWIGYLMPLTYFVEIARGVMVRGAPITALGPPFAYLAIMGAVVFGLATLYFRRTLAPSRAADRRQRRSEPEAVAAAR